MKSTNNIYFYIILYIVLLFFILSNNNEKTAIISLITINILLYSNLKIENICKLIIIITIITQLLSLYNFKIRESYQCNEPRYPESNNISCRQPENIYLNDGNKICVEDLIQCNPGFDINTLDTMVTNIRSSNKAKYENYMINKSLQNALYEINTEFYNYYKFLSNNLITFARNVRQDYESCSSYESHPSNLDVTYNSIVSSNDESSNQLKKILEIIRDINIIIGKRYENTDGFNYIPSSPEGFISEFKKNINNEIKYFSNSLVNNINIKEGMVREGTTMPYTGWYKITSDKMVYDSGTNPTLINFDKLDYGGLLCEIFDFEPDYFSGYNFHNLTYLDLILRINQLKNDIETRHVKGDVIKNCSKLDDSLNYYNIRGNDASKDIFNDNLIGDNDIFMNPISVVNSLEIMNYRYRNSTFNNITRGPHMLPTKCHNNSFMNYFLLFTGEITFKFNEPQEWTDDKKPWFEIMFQANDYGCMIIHPTYITHEEILNNQMLNEHKDECVIIQTPRFISGRQKASQFLSTPILKNGTKKNIFNTLTNSNNNLLLEAYNREALSSLNGDGVSFNITIIYIQHNGGGNLRLQWNSIQNQHEAYKDTLVSYKSSITSNNLSSTIPPLIPNIGFHPKTGYATNRFSEFHNWHQTNKRTSDVWMFAYQGTPFHRAEETYRLGSFITANNSLAKVGFTGSSREGMEDIKHHPCPCIRLDENGEFVNQAGDCKVSEQGTNYDIAEKIYDIVGQLNNKVLYFQEFSSEKIFGNIRLFRKHTLRIMLKNLLCQVLFNDGILLNQDKIISAYISSDIPLNRMIPGKQPLVQDELVQQFRRFLDADKPYAREIYKIIYLYNLTVTSEITYNHKKINFNVNSLANKNWLTESEDNANISDFNDLKFYDDYDSLEFNKWHKSITFKPHDQIETIIKNNTNHNYKEDSISIEFIEFNYDDSNPTARIIFAGAEYVISLKNDYLDCTLSNIDNIIARSVSLINSTLHENFKSKEGFNSKWSKTSIGKSCLDSYNNQDSSLMSEECITNEIEYIINNYNIEEIHNIFKEWFCNPEYSPSGPNNFFKNLADNAIKCTHRKDPCECPTSNYSMVYDNKDLNYEPTYDLNQCILFVIKFLELYDQIFCFLETFNYANNNNIINGPNGLIAIFPLIEHGGDKFVGSSVKPCNTLEEIKKNKAEFENNYFNNNKFILYNVTSGANFKIKLQESIFKTIEKINITSVMKKVKTIKECEIDLVKYVCKNMMDTGSGSVPYIIKDCYTCDQHFIDNNNIDRNTNTLTCEIDSSSLIDITDRQKN